jgi:hypothetical protein
MQDFYFAKGSKNFEECSRSEKYAIISLLKEELNLFTKIKWFRITTLRKLAQIFAVRLEAYKFDKYRDVYKW